MKNRKNQVVDIYFSGTNRYKAMIRASIFLLGIVFLQACENSSKKNTVHEM